MSETDDASRHYSLDDTAPFDVMAFVALFDDAYPPSRDALASLDSLTHRLNHQMPPIAG